jgi:O-antigen/teichoic acid export membrane protein
MWPRLWALLRGEAAGNLLGLLACTAVSQACGLGIILLAATHLGQAGLGMFLFGLTVTTYLTLVGGAGAGQVLIREVAGGRGRLDGNVTTYFLLVGGMTLTVTLLAAVAVAVAAEGEERWLWVWLLVGNVAASVSLLPLFDAQHRQARAAAAAACVDVAALGVCAWLAWSDRLTVPRAGLLMAAKWLATFLAQLAVYHRSVRPVRWDWDGANVRKFASAGLKLLTAYLLLQVPLNGGVVLVRLLRSPEETAVMGLATQVSSVYFLYCWQVIRVAQPHITGPHGEEPWFIWRLAVSLAILMSCGGMAILGGAIAALWLLLPTYVEAWRPAIFLLSSSAFLAVGLVLACYLQRHGQESTVLWGQAAGCAVFVLLAVPLTHGLGAAGASLASLLGGLAVLACLALMPLLRARAVAVKV